MRKKYTKWIDPRKGKKFNEIYKNGYKHPQQKPFKIQLKNTEKIWEFQNEKEFEKTLKIYAYPALNQLKKTGQMVIKKITPNTKHQFKKGDMLLFEYL